MKIEQKNLNFSKTQYFSKNSKFSKNSFFFKKFKFSEKSKFSKCHIPSTAFFIYEIAFFTTKVGSLVFKKMLLSLKCQILDLNMFLPGIVVFRVLQSDAFVSSTK